MLKWEKSCRCLLLMHHNFVMFSVGCSIQLQHCVNYTFPHITSVTDHGKNASAWYESFNWAKALFSLLVHASFFLIRLGVKPTKVFFLQEFQFNHADWQKQCQQANIKKTESLECPIEWWNSFFCEVWERTECRKALKNKLNLVVKGFSLCCPLFLCFCGNSPDMCARFLEKGQSAITLSD